jgi:hypothetical protein
MRRPEALQERRERAKEALVGLFQPLEAVEQGVDFSVVGVG